MGTPLYMAPEQIMGHDLTDARSDIYSLGATAYQLLTGQPPFLDKTVAGLIKAHVAATVLPPSQLEPGIPEDLESIILRCLAKRPTDRFANVNQIEAALADCSCAEAWSPLHAETWWQEREAGPARVLVA
jgi:serine/threonine-protein kinase